MESKRFSTSAKFDAQAKPERYFTPVKIAARAENGRFQAVGEDVFALRERAEKYTLDPLLVGDRPCG